MLTKSLPFAFWAMPKLMFNPLIVILNEWQRKRHNEKLLDENEDIEIAKLLNDKINRRNEKCREINEQLYRENLQREE
jgi:hypothetical protein